MKVKPVILHFKTIREEDTKAMAPYRNPVPFSQVDARKREAMSKARFYRVVGQFHYTDFQKIRDAVKEKYGMATEVETKTLTNGFGAEYTSEEVSWWKKEWAITISEREGKVDVGQFVMNYFPAAPDSGATARKDAQDL